MQLMTYTYNECIKCISQALARSLLRDKGVPDGERGIGVHHGARHSSKTMSGSPHPLRTPAKPRRRQSQQFPRFESSVVHRRSFFRNCQDDGKVYCFSFVRVNFEVWKNILLTQPGTLAQFSKRGPTSAHFIVKKEPLGIFLTVDKYKFLLCI